MRFSILFKPVRVLLFLISVSSVLLIQSNFIYAISQSSLDAIINNHPFYVACGTTQDNTTAGGSLPAGSSVYILGDSITAMAKSVYEQEFKAKGYTADVDGSSSRSLNGKGVDGNKLTGMQAIAQDADQIKKAGAIVVALGTNGGNTNDSIDAAIKAIRQANPKAPIYWVDTMVINRPDYAPLINENNAAIYANAGRDKYTVISWAKTVTPGADPQHLTSTEKDANKYIIPYAENPDASLGVHPTPAGITALVNLVISSVSGGGGSSGTPTTTPTPSEGGDSSSTTDLAKQMLSNPNISYWTNNGVNTRDVVVALSQGKKAYTTAANATEKEVDLNPAILKFILEAAKKGKVMVNALTDKTHSNGSNHYKGLAVDLDNNASNTTVAVTALDEIATKYGGKRNSETSHWHYDFLSKEPTSSADSSSKSSVCCVSGSSSSTQLSGSDNAAIVWNYLSQKGLNDIQVAGIMGNLQQEGGFNPTIVNPDSGAYGIAQWLGGRLSNLSAFAASQGKDKSDLGVQLDFLWQELTTSYKSSTLDPIKSATTLSDVVDIWLRHFEIPCNPSDGGCWATENSNRLPFAQQWLVKASGGDISSTATVSSSSCGDGNSNSGTPIGDINAYFQSDPQWANHPYGSSVIGNTGCGPTSLATVISTLTNDKSITPNSIADEMGNKYYQSGAGTTWDAFTAVPQAHGLKSQSSNDINAVIAALKTGNALVIVSVQPGIFTKGGHIMVLRGVTSDGKIEIIQTGESTDHHPQTDQTYDPGVIVSNSEGSANGGAAQHPGGQYWIITK